MIFSEAPQKINFLKPSGSFFQKGNELFANFPIQIFIYICYTQKFIQNLPPIQSGFSRNRAAFFLGASMLVEMHFDNCNHRFLMS